MFNVFILLCNNNNVKNINHLHTICIGFSYFDTRYKPGNKKKIFA